MSEESLLVFTDSAATKVKSLIEEENNPALMLRVFVSRLHAVRWSRVDQHGFKLRHGKRRETGRCDWPMKTNQTCLRKEREMQRRRAVRKPGGGWIVGG